MVGRCLLASVNSFCADFCVVLASANDPIFPYVIINRNVWNASCTNSNVSRSPPLSGCACNTVVCQRFLTTLNSSARVAQSANALAGSAIPTAARQEPTVDLDKRVAGGGFFFCFGGIFGGRE